MGLDVIEREFGLPYGYTWTPLWTDGGYTMTADELSINIIIDVREW